MLFFFFLLFLYFLFFFFFFCYWQLISICTSQTNRGVYVLHNVKTRSWCWTFCFVFLHCNNIEFLSVCKESGEHAKVHHHKYPQAKLLDKDILQKKQWHGWVQEVAKSPVITKKGNVYHVHPLTLFPQTWLTGDRIRRFKVYFVHFSHRAKRVHVFYDDKMLLRTVIFKYPSPRFLCQWRKDRSLSMSIGPVDSRFSFFRRL